MSLATKEFNPASTIGVEIPCTLCDSENLAVLFKPGEAQEGGIVKCRECGLIFTNPRGRVELDDYRAEGEKGWTLSDSCLERAVTQLRDFRKVINRAVAHAPGGRVLEIGCNTGHLLHALSERGMQCVGVEPNLWAARYAREQLGVEIETASMEEVEFEDNSFDVILVFHVIAHVTNPLTALRKLHRWLRPGGLLTVESPRQDTLAFRLLGRRERNVVDSWRLYFFDRSTLPAILEKGGFEILSHEYPSRSVTMSRIWVNVGKMTHLHWLSRFGESMASSKINKRLAIPINMRGLLRLYARKPLVAPDVAIENSFKS